MPLHTRRRVIEAMLNEILGLNNKPQAAVHSVHKVTGLKRRRRRKKKKKKKPLVYFLEVSEPEL